MIALLATGAQMTDVANAGNQAETMHSGRPMPYRDDNMERMIGPAEPPIFAYPRKPFGGLRMPFLRVLHDRIPPTPNGPPQVIAPHRRGYVASGSAPTPQNRAATAWVGVEGVERAAWYEGI